jgi:hypothetical protein
MLVPGRIRTHVGEGRASESEVRRPGRASPRQIDGIARIELSNLRSAGRQRVAFLSLSLVMGALRRSTRP